MPDACRMASDADWPGKPRVCPHSQVIASGGTCADNLCDCTGNAAIICPPCRAAVYE